MEYYVGATFLSVVIAFLIKKKFGFEKHKFLKMFISILPLTVISGLRYNVGWDYPNYATAFSNYGIFGKLYFDEIGFKTIVEVLSSITNDYVYLFILFSIAISFFFSKCFEKYGKEKNALTYILLFVLTRYFFCSLNIVRQALAMIMVVYSFCYIKDERNIKNYLKTFAIILLAASLHKFAIIFIPLSLLLPHDFKEILKNKYLYIGLMVVSVTVFVFAVSSGYLSYFDTMFGNDGTVAISELLISLIVILFGLAKYKTLSQEKENVIFLNMEVIALFVCLASPFIPTADRIVWYFNSASSIFLIPAILNQYNRKAIKLGIATIIVTSLGVVLYNQIIRTDSYDVMPYNHVFEEGSPWNGEIVR